MTNSRLRSGADLISRQAEAAGGDITPADFLLLFDNDEYALKKVSLQTLSTQGLAGRQGIQGVQGLNGLFAAQGIQGLQGLQGIKGEFAAQGIQGLQGVQGTQGLQGTQGIAGAPQEWHIETANYVAVDGDRIIADTSAAPFVILLPSNPVVGSYLQITDGGDWSINNLTVDRNGSTIEGQTANLDLNLTAVTVEFIYDGSTWQLTATLGPQGTQGIQGVQGTQGIQGVQGLQGLQGIQGIQGVQGLTGTQGLQGTQGVQGIDGAFAGKGLDGLQGLQGLQGLAGEFAAQGLQGPAGPQGTQGITGSQGTQGTQGVRGFQGTQGTTGAQGVQGTQGITGAQGVQGTQGILGIQGVQGLTGNPGDLNNITGISEAYVRLENSSGTVVHNLADAAIFVHVNPSADFIASFISVPTTDLRNRIVTLIIQQGSTAYIPSSILVNGFSETVRWNNNTAPAGTDGQIDVISYSFLRSGSSWIILGQSSSFVQ